MFVKGKGSAIKSSATAIQAMRALHQPLHMK